MGRADPLPSCRILLRLVVIMQQGPNITPNLRSGVHLIVKLNKPVDHRFVFLIEEQFLQLQYALGNDPLHFEIHKPLIHSLVDQTPGQRKLLQMTALQLEQQRGQRLGRMAQLVVTVEDI